MGMAPAAPPLSRLTSEMVRKKLQTRMDRPPETMSSKKISIILNEQIIQKAKSHREYSSSSMPVIVGISIQYSDSNATMEEPDKRMKNI